MTAGTCHLIAQPSVRDSSTERASPQARRNAVARRSASSRAGSGSASLTRARPVGVIVADGRATSNRVVIPERMTVHFIRDITGLPMETIYAILDQHGIPYHNNIVHRSDVRGVDALKRLTP